MQPMKETFIYYLSQIGRLAIASNGKAVTRLSFCPAKWCNFLPYEEDAVLQIARRQLDEYFNGSRKYFDLPLEPTGSLFQLKVWGVLCQIPYGKTCSYKELARAVGNEKAARAVGGANHVNPIAIMIPCHRVIGSGGKLTGYAGGLERKKFLLALENSSIFK